MFDNWSTLKKLIWLKRAIISAGEIIKTVTGTIVTFTAKRAAPLKKLVAQIDPVQDLHGYDNPWPAGGRKNKLPNDATTSTIQGVTFTVNADKTITANGTSTGWIGLTVSTFTLPAGEYKLVSLVNPAYAYNYYLSLNKSGTAVASTSSNPNGVAFTLTEETTLVCKLLARPNNALSNLVCYPMIILATETDVSYLPYSNICPISGWTGLQGKRTGVNVWDEEWENGTFNTTTGENIDTEAALSQIRAKHNIPIKAGQEYYVVADIGIWAMFLDADGVPVDPPSGRYGHSGKSVQFGGIYTNNFIAPTNSRFMKFYEQASYGSTYNNDIAINYPSTDQDYHAYSGESLSVNWQDTAGTVYGGNIVVNEDGSGVLTATHALWIKNTVTMDNGTAYPGWRSAGIREIIGSGKNQVFQNQMLNIGSVFAINTISNNDIIYLPTNIYNKTQDEWKSLAIDVQIVAKLATPVTYNLTAEQLSTILGTNNIWVDTGDVSVTYIAN